MIERFLAPIDTNSRCGPDLEYDADFLRLQQSAAGRPEQQYGATLIAAETPDWAEVERLAQSLLARTRDLRIAPPLVRAWIDSRGLEGYADGLTLVRTWLDDYWDDLHPALSVDGEADPAPRMNALAELVGAHACAGSAREQLLAGTLSVREVADVLDGRALDAAHYPGGPGRLKRELERLRDEGGREWLATQAVLDGLDAIRAIVTTRLGAQWIPEPSRCELALRRIGHEVGEPPGGDTRDAGVAQRDASAHGNTDVNVDAGQGYRTGRNSAPGVPPPHTWRDAEFTNRGDVGLLLDKICRYFEDHEPSHPAPLLLRRVQRLLTLDFYEIVRDIAPESLQQVELLSGRRTDA
ncbi:type VI secretion system protein TssA [Paraburkholderia madseniana]|uniref:type VI secretion system protein TssA n=1 Tax=Paraburkholderia madseniana TaxID=2599607 RepID=UPI001F23F7A9|nr:type VI secretion system protein TssA [Paraburkholderia madseniana]